MKTGRSLAAVELEEHLLQIELRLILLRALEDEAFPRVHDDIYLAPEHDLTGGTGDHVNHLPDNRQQGGSRNPDNETAQR